MRLALSLSLLILLFSGTARAQELLPNPSFEGPARESLPPPPWQNCRGSASTQPGQFGIIKSAIDESTYVGLTVQGDDYFSGNQAGARTAIGAFSIEPILAGEAYDFTISLSADSSFLRDGVRYASPTRLRVFIGKGECARQQLIWRTIPIGHYRWQEYTVRFTAEAAADFILLEAEFEDETARKTGVIFIDAARLEKSFPTVEEPQDTSTAPVEGCAIYLPNAFSPNDDGRNDVFLPALACQPVAFHLAIYDRWGGKAFESRDSRRGWDGKMGGKPAPAGLYVYLVEYEYGSGQKAREYGALHLFR
jgi:gliding motility-associated-like protein